MLELFNFQFHHVKAACLFDVDAVDAHECVDDDLTAVGRDGVAHALRDYLNAHAWLNADAVGVLDVFGRDDKTCHSDWI